MTAPPISLRSPSDLLAVIPHLLGFEPRNAIVVLALKDNKIDLTQRMDLPDPNHVDEVAHALQRHVLKEQADGALLVGYENTAGDSWPLVEALSERLRARDVGVRDRIIVHDGRWRSLDCTDPSCCPPQGTAVPPPAEASSVLAEFVGVGSAPLDDRRALAEQLEPGPAARDVDERLKQEPRAPTSLARAQRLRRLAEVWARVLTRPHSVLGITDAAAALQSLRDVSTRDGLAAVLIPNGLELDLLPQDTQLLVQRCSSAIHAAVEEHDADMTTGAIKSRLIDLCRHSTDDHAAPALTLLATYSWWHGDGALARVALDRALRCEPEYRLAQLLRLMLDEGIRPERP
ncbi:DUF4192 domain-containing protein [Terrabacter sp. 2RAF25]|uniref:DUF4192 domain-containing protein n=1 Tax=Terrabacter sp. 2RAF25 TaxID=3232998 RepID=UPI003F98E817